jgi:hypothetical protein
LTGEGEGGGEKNPSREEDGFSGCNHLKDRKGEDMPIYEDLCGKCGQVNEFILMGKG